MESLDSAYIWIVIVGAIVAFIMAYGIGANDVANAFATSVGAKTLTMRQAVCFAAVAEFVGALALGGNVARTIAGGIADVKEFVGNPEVFMYGMLCALTAAAVWVLLATYLEFPVSTTHSIVGAVIGFSLAYGGSVLWYGKASEFPYLAGVVPIVLSWVISPLLSGALTFVLFTLVRWLVLRRRNSVALSYWCFPVFVFIAVFVNVFFVLYKGASKVVALNPNKAAWVAAVSAAGASLFVIIFIMPYIRRRVQAETERREAAQELAKVTGLAVSQPPGTMPPIEDTTLSGKEVTADHDVTAPPPTGLNGGQYSKANQDCPAAELRKHDLEAGRVTEEQAHAKGGWFGYIIRGLEHGVNVDIHQIVHEDKHVHHIHDRSEKFDPGAEHSFKYVQVFTAFCVSFAHGANDVANSIGPFAAIYSVWTTHKVSKNAAVPVWILAIGAAGIVIGLGTYGYNIMRVLGVKMVTMTPSRGFLAELSTALVIALGSRYGLPLSTTHCQVGSTAGVGLAEGMLGVNWRCMLWCAVGWLLTLIVAGLLSALLFAQGAYAPSALQH